MKYRAFIEQYFLIDEPKQGKLVPFTFNIVQNAYYEELKALGIEEKGISAALREFIVKARREGFSSLILAIFAADDLMQENPTESQVVSYKDEATKTFRRRYRRYILSYYAQKSGSTVEEIQKDANILEKYSKAAFAVDSTDLVLRHNQAHFYCGTASARTGGRGGVLQKLLFSEAAHYPDTENMTAAETIEGTSQQVDKESGWIFQESTANGKGNLFYRTYEQIIRGLSRYKLRFYGWRSFYSQEQFDVISSEFIDADMLKQEYPETIEEAFLSSGLSFTSSDRLHSLVGAQAEKRLDVLLEMRGVNYIDQCETIKTFVNTYVQTHPNRSVYLGTDSAKHVDATVLSVILGADLLTNGGVRGIACDSTGQGDFIPDWFEKNTSWYVHRVTFSRASKSVMYKNLQTVIQKKGTTLLPFILSQEKQGPTNFITPEWQNWYKQMLNLQKEIIGNMLVVEHPKGKCPTGEHDYDNCIHHDDYPDSWAMAELLYTAINGVPVGQHQPKDDGGFDGRLRKLLKPDTRRSNGRKSDNFD